jgi:alpha-ketoglutarate-dependent taurine dioxygenase
MSIERMPLRKLVPVERKSVRLGDVVNVRTEPLRSGEPLPLLVRATTPGQDLAAWAGENRPAIENHLMQHGGILFRGFQVASLPDFQRVVSAVGGDLLEYRYRSTPRTEVTGRIYTSTEYPANQEIPLHNENSYSQSWPLKIFFFCEQPATTGGTTPIADSARIYDRIPASLRDRFREKRVMYVRNYGGGADLPWQEVFQTQDSAEVDAFCRDHGIGVEWLPGGRLRTRQVCQAVVRHPKTGRMLWFNQAHLFHVSSLEPEVREAMLEVFGPDELPRNAFYGDASPLEEAALAEIRQIYREEQVTFAWEQADVLLLDNMAVAHGRTPYTGPRKIRVGMTEPVDGAALAG